MKPAWVLAALTVACALGTYALVTGMRSGRALPRWNVLLISVDTLRADHLGCYGCGRDTSPAIDALAAEGTLFRSCVAAAPWTHPSHMSMLTGQYPTVHGVLSLGNRARAGCVTLAELLREHGYRTGAVISGGGMRAEEGFGRGFETYDDYSVLKACLAGAPAAGEVLPEGSDLAACTVTVPTSEFTAEAALKWLSEWGGRPFFLFLHYWDVHWDYCPPAPYDSLFDPGYEGPMKGRKADLDTWLFPGCSSKDLQHAVALYDGEIRWTDLHIAQVLDGLRRLGLYDSTVVILTADHGDEFLEHGGRGHGHSLYEELLHVPLIVKLPRRLQPQAPAVSEPVSLVDIMPTVLDLLGIAQPEDPAGVSLLPALLGKSAPPRRPLFAEGVLGRNMCMVRLGPRKLMLDLDSGWRASYDLASDAGESAPQPAGSNWEDELYASVNTWLANKQTQAARLGDNGSTAEADQETRKMLRSLGYVQ